MALNDFKKYDKGNSWTKCHGSVVSWLICRRACKLFFLNGFKSKKIGAYKSDLSKANERAQCFFDLQINLHVMNTFLFICQFNQKFFFRILQEVLVIFGADQKDRRLWKRDWHDNTYRACKWIKRWLTKARTKLAIKPGKIPGK